MFIEGNSDSECYICKNHISYFLSNLRDIEVDGSYKLSVLVPKSYLVREENVFDLFMGKSIKYQLPRLVREKIKGKRSEVYADYLIEISFPDASYKIKRQPLFVYGKYWKFKPNLSQKRWVGRNIESIENIIGKAFLSVIGGKDFVLHASGREDVDAENIAGRPFVIEVKEPGLYDISNLTTAIEKKVNETKLLKIKLFGKVDGSFVSLVSDSHFDKAYRAYLSEPLSIYEQQTVKNGIEGKTIRQKTPTRVLHRRVDIERKRKVFNVSFGKDRRGFYMDVECEAGLYVKELISGDGGRTTPSVSEIVGREIKCIHLVVTKIKDGFLDLQFNLRYGSH